MFNVGEVSYLSILPLMAEIFHFYFRTIHFLCFVLQFAKLMVEEKHSIGKQPSDTFALIFSDSNTVRVKGGLLEDLCFSDR